MLRNELQWSLSGENFVRPGNTNLLASVGSQCWTQLNNYEIDYKTKTYFFLHSMCERLLVVTGLFCSLKSMNPYLEFLWGRILSGIWGHFSVNIYVTMYQ